ncbi:MAG TPA: alpha/beta hydrolase [Pseudonocardiaceae bacterium]|nr:alpha/beta hydrolase [Pseudonocardiaceae bacterium]
MSTTTSNERVKDPLLYFLSGATPLFVCRADQRVSYCLYIPQRVEGDPERFPLIVVQHGTARTAVKYRDAFRQFCEKNRCVVLAPLIPAGIGDDPEDLHSFKFLSYQGIRFDLLLLELVAEAARRFPIDGEKFMLYGFSGGGQFAHRFLYLHPERLSAVSIGAPGRITQLSGDRWWLGTQGMKDIFGAEPSIEAIRRVPVQMVVGDQDVETWEINNPGGPNWMDGVELTGNTRIERLRTLEANFRSHGIDVRFDLVPGVGHSGVAVAPVVEDFMAGLLRG